MIQLAALLAALDQHFGLDSRGRLLPGDETPLFLLLRSEQGVVWRFHAQLGEERVLRAARLAGREPAPEGASPPECPPPERLFAITSALGAREAQRLRCWRRADERADLFEWLPADEEIEAELLPADLWFVR